MISMVVRPRNSLMPPIRQEREGETRNGSILWGLTLTRTHIKYPQHQRERCSRSEECVCVCIQHADIHRCERECLRERHSTFDIVYHGSRHHLCTPYFHWGICRDRNLHHLPNPDFRCSDPDYRHNHI